MADPARQDWEIQRYTPGLETGVIDLFRTVFGKARSLEHWRWEFRDNPYGGPFVSTARRKSDGLVVGSYSVMPMMLNLAGRAVLGAQSVDTAVHPDHRGQRMFETLANDCYAWCEAEGVAAVFGFPNANSYPGFLRSLGWKRIGFFTEHMRRLTVAPTLRRMLRVPLVPALGDGVYRASLRANLKVGRNAAVRRGAAGEFEVTSTVPDGYDDLWNAARSMEVLSIWKDAAYFRWRYDQNPDHSFQYFVLRRDAEILAVAVGLEIRGGIELCELVTRSRDVGIGRRLMAEIALHALATRQRALTLMGHDVGYLADIADGFVSRRSYANVFCGRAFGTGSVADFLPHADNWTITFGDTDFV